MSPSHSTVPGHPSSATPWLGRDTGIADAAVAEVAYLIDHTLLRPTATRAEILATCAEGRYLGTRTVCIPPRWVALASTALSQSPTQVCTVIGFPHGNSSTSSKIAEATEAMNTGARELDLVVSLGDLCDDDSASAQRLLNQELQLFVAECLSCDPNVTIKVILESALLSDDQLKRGCEAVVRAGAHFVKTSTGFASCGATAHAVALMRACVGNEVGVKASGGIRSAQDALLMVQAGASRLGTSATATILEEWTTRQRESR